VATHEPIIQGLREWIHLTTKLDRLKIIPVDDPFPRPQKPYITIDLPVLDDDGGTDEAIGGIDTSDRPIVTGRGFRTTQATITGHGESTADLIMKASLDLVKPSILALMRTNNFSLRPISPLIAVPTLLSDKREKRFAKDFQLQYLLMDTDPEVLLEVATIEVGLTLANTDSALSDLLDTLIINC